MMVGFIRDEAADSPYQMQIRMIPIKEVMLYERILPEEYINQRGNDVTEAFVKWCRPLIGERTWEYMDFQELYEQENNGANNRADVPE